MNRVQLGNSGLSVSPVAIGTWQLSPRFWGEQSKDDYVDALRFAFAEGINLIDTAEAYGDGYAETVVGEAITDLPRDELVIVTKVFNHFNDDGTRYPDLSPEHIAARSTPRPGQDPRLWRQQSQCRTASRPASLWSLYRRPATL